MPIEEVAGTVKDLIQEGKVKHWGLSEAGRLEENLGAADVELTPEELRDLNDALSKIEISGDRNPAGSDYANRTGK